MITNEITSLRRCYFVFVQITQKPKKLLAQCVQEVKNQKNKNNACIFIQNMVLFMHRNY